MNGDVTTRTAPPAVSRRLWLGTVGVQGLGALATLAVGLLIARVQGPLAQGHYGLLRSSADLLLALSLLGLPQGMVHLLNHLRATPQRVEHWLRRYTLALAVMAGLLLVGVWFSPLQPDAPVDVLALLGLAVGVFGWVVNGLQRAFVLCRGSTAQFSWLTVLPSLALLAAVAVLAGVGSQRFELAMAFSGAASAACGTWVLRALQRDPAWRQGAAAPWQALVSPSAHALVQTTALALQPYLALQLLQHAYPGGPEVGWFVFASYLAQAFALPVGFVAPLVFARASWSAGWGAVSAPSRAASASIRKVGWLAVAVSLLLAAILPVAVPTFFGASYGGAVGACVAIALGGPALLVGRLHTALLLGAGRFASVTMLFGLRAALVPLGILAMWRWTPLGPVTGAATGWALAEVITSTVQAALVATTASSGEGQSREA